MNYTQFESYSCEIGCPICFMQGRTVMMRDMAADRQATCPVHGIVIADNTALVVDTFIRSKPEWLPYWQAGGETCKKYVPGESIVPSA